MNAFKDNKGRSYEIILDQTTLERFKAEGWDLRADFQHSLFEIMSDVQESMSALYLCIQPQAEAYGLDKISWFDAIKTELRGDQIVEMLCGFLIATAPREQRGPVRRICKKGLKAAREALIISQTPGTF